MTFRALAGLSSERIRRRAKRQFSNLLEWPIHIINQLMKPNILKKRLDLEVLPEKKRYSGQDIKLQFNLQFAAGRISNCELWSKILVVMAFN